MENLDHHHSGAVPSSYEIRSNNSNIKSGKNSQQPGAENNIQSGNNGSKQVSRRAKNSENSSEIPGNDSVTSPSAAPATAAAGQPRKSSSSSKKENRKSTPAMTGSNSHVSPSRQQQQQQGIEPRTTSGEKSGSGGKRRDHPSGVGAVGGRGSILHNTVNPLLTEVRFFFATFMSLITLCKN